jgi:hypothetical protein
MDPGPLPHPSRACHPCAARGASLLCETFGVWGGERAALSALIGAE